MIPEMPVDFGELATMSMTVVGKVIVGCLGAYMIVVLLRMGIKWLVRAFDLEFMFVDEDDPDTGRAIYEWEISQSGGSPWE